MWQLVVISSALFGGIFNLINKRLTSINPLKAVFYPNLVSSLLLLFFLPQLSLPVDFIGWFFIFIGGFLWIAIRLLYLRVYTHFDISLAVPLLELRVALVLVLSVLLLGEIISFLELLGFALMFSGVFIATFRCKKHYKINKKGVLFLASLIVVSSFVKIVDSLGVKQFNVFTYIFAIYWFTTIVTFFLIKRKGLSLRLVKHGKFMFSLGVIGVLSYLLTLYAYTLTEVSNITILSKLSIAVSLVGGFIFYKEKGKVRKSIATVLILIGALVVAL